MPNFVKIAELHELPPGAGRAFPAGSRSIALFQVNGTIYALDNACPHRGGSLAGGGITEFAVACPLHAWRFDVRSGDCLSRPDRRVSSYAVELRDGAVLVDLPAAAPTASPAPPACASDSAAPAEYVTHELMVRFGAMGYVGRFAASQPLACSRGTRVVVQTSRGVEAGEVLVTRPQDEPSWDSQPKGGRILRLFGPEDQLLERGLRAGEERAFQACRQILAERGLPVELIDAEQLLDGETLVFYFLGDAPPQLADVKAELAHHYEARIEFRQFMERVAEGCGPGCGTAEAAGCGACGEGGCGADACNTCPVPHRS
jgi:nitrite reductase/ring-hydroxylating ferredoxin subunit